MKQRPIDFLFQYVSEIRWYLFPQFLFLTLGILIILFYKDHNAFLYLNRLHIPILDRPALWLSEISSGLIITSVYILLFAKKHPGETILTVILVFITWYTCIALAYSFFQHWQSPNEAFKSWHPHVLGISLQPELNFPSVHAAIIAALVTTLVHFKKPRKWAMLVFSFIGLLISYTRLYIGWSYLSDILAGILLGMCVTIICLHPIEQWVYKWFAKRSEWAQGITIAVLRTAAICTIFSQLKYMIL